MKMSEMPSRVAGRLLVLQHDDRGSAYVEYVLLIVLIAVVCLLALNYFGQSTSGTVDNAASVVARS